MAAILAPILGGLAAGAVGSLLGGGRSGPTVQSTVPNPLSVSGGGLFDTVSTGTATLVGATTTSRFHLKVEGTR